MEIVEDDGKTVTKPVSTSMKKNGASASDGPVFQWGQDGKIAGIILANGNTIEPMVWRSHKKILATQYPPHRWLIPGLLPEGLIAFFAASGVGKSRVSIGVALRVALDGHDVGYISKDDTDEEGIQEKLRWASDGRETVGTVRFTYETPRLDEGLLDALAADLEMYPKTRLYVIDVFADIESIKPKRDVYGEEKRMFTEIKNFAISRHITVLVCHHTNKKPYDPNNWESSINGSMGLLGGSSAKWGLFEIGERKLRMHFKGKRLAEGAIDFDLDDYDMLTLDECVRDAREAAEEAANKAARANLSTRDAILAALQGVVDGMGSREIAQSADRDRATVRKELQRMKADGLVVEVGGKYALPQACHRLATGHEAA